MTQDATEQVQDEGELVAVELREATVEQEVLLPAAREPNAQSPAAEACHERGRTPEHAALAVPLGELDLGDFVIEGLLGRSDDGATEGGHDRAPPRRRWQGRWTDDQVAGDACEAEHGSGSARSILPSISLRGPAAGRFRRW